MLPVALTAVVALVPAPAVVHTSPMRAPVARRAGMVRLQNIDIQKEETAKACGVSAFSGGLAAMPMFERLYGMSGRRVFVYCSAKGHDEILDTAAEWNEARAEYLSVVEKIQGGGTITAENEMAKLSKGKDEK